MDWVRILGAAVAGYVIGAIWYGPLFGEMWMKLTGMTKAKIAKSKDKMPMMYLGGFLTAFVTATVLSFVIGLAGWPAMWQNGAILGFWAWLGFVATFSFSPVIWQDQPVQLWMLNNAYNLLILLVMGGILGA